MKADEIREKFCSATPDYDPMIPAQAIQAGIVALGEVAAQLAELNETLKGLTIVRAAPFTSPLIPRGEDFCKCRPTIGDPSMGSKCGRCGKREALPAIPSTWTRTFRFTCARPNRSLWPRARYGRESDAAMAEITVIDELRAKEEAEFDRLRAWRRKLQEELSETADPRRRNEINLTISRISDAFANHW